ncbi:hypothetical protein ACF0H5_016507 [Mactra antiquata]
MAAEYRMFVSTQQSDLPFVPVCDRPDSRERSSNPLTGGPATLDSSSQLFCVWFSATLPDESPCLLTGVTFVGRDVIVCDNENKTLKRFDVCGKFHEELFLRDPCGICSLPNSVEVAVTEPDIRQITVCKLDNSLEVIFELKTMKKYECITSYQDKYVVGCCQLGATCVDFIDSNGTVLRTIPGTLDGQILFRNPAAIACQTSGDVVISDPGACALTCITPNTKIKFSKSMSERPSGVCVDYKGSIYVAQYDANLVYKLSKTGCKDGVVVDRKQKLTSPLAMSVNGSLLAVTEETPSDKIFIIQLPGLQSNSEESETSLSTLCYNTV